MRSKLSTFCLLLLGAVQADATVTITTDCSGTWYTLPRDFAQTEIVQRIIDDEFIASFSAEARGHYQILNDTFARIEAGQIDVGALSDIDKEVLAKRLLDAAEALRQFGPAFTSNAEAFRTYLVTIEFTAAAAEITADLEPMPKWASSPIATCRIEIDAELTERILNQTLKHLQRRAELRLRR
ncbi:MAG: hypothetical protein AAFX44_05890 [Pseudomonadota bacterium]